MAEGERVIPGADPKKIKIASIQPNTFALGGFTLETYPDFLAWLVIVNGDTVAHVFTLTLRTVGGGPPITAALTIPVGSSNSIPALGVISIAIDTASSSVAYWYSDEPLLGPSPATGSGVSSPGGNIIRDVTAAEAATLGITLPAIVIYTQTGTSGTVILNSASPIAQFDVSMVAGAITGLGSGYTFGYESQFKIGSNGIITRTNAIATTGTGAPVIRGIDDRNTVLSTDGAPITVYAVPGTTGKFRITVTLVGRAGTVTSAIYTFKFTVAGVVITQTVSLSAVDTVASTSQIVLPDLSTNITGQLTTLTGASASVDITCVVEAIGGAT